MSIGSDAPAVEHQDDWRSRCRLPGASCDDVPAATSLLIVMDTGQEIDTGCDGGLSELSSSIIVDVVGGDVGV